ncbi:protein FAM200B-like [Macrobrachium nipponense]|uniref:protein FAM200B-like n=1 Tax=Macrobrachium nipponense TaxID=159736 RepID=UPI0030C802B4
MVSFIKQRLLKSRMFARSCETMQKDHVTLLLHTEVRWLSREKVLSRVLELREELLLFFKENDKVDIETDYQEIIPLITSHLESLAEKLDQYFPSLSSDLYDWVRNPFTEMSSNLQTLLNLQEEEEITELKCDRTLRIMFDEVPLDVFWISVREEYPFISAKALDILFQFSTSYLCEQDFSCLSTVLEIVFCLMRKICGCVCQKFARVLRNYTTTNKPKYHNEIKTYDYGDFFV